MNDKENSYSSDWVYTNPTLKQVIIIFVVVITVCFLVAISANKLNAGIWFCNGDIIEDPCMGGKPQ